MNANSGPPSDATAVKRAALEQLQKGTQMLRAGQLGLAQSHCQRAAKLDPDNADAWHLLGIAALQTGNAALAAKHLRASVRLRPAFAEAHNNLGVALRRCARNREAVAAFHAALAARFGYVDAAFNLGITHEADGNPIEAERAYRQALAWRADHADAAINLGNLLREHGRLDEALTFLEVALRLAPDRAQANGNFALLLGDLGRQAEAVRFAAVAVSLDPEQALWWKTLGVAQRLLHDVGNATATLRKARELDPADAATALELALALSEGGDSEQARMLFATTPAPPGSAERVRWLRALALPAIYRDETEIDISRREFALGLETLHAGLSLDRAADIHEAVVAAASVAPFHLHYQPHDNTDLQCSFGDLVARVMARAAPELASPCAWRLHANDRRVRVGIVSSHLMQHTVSRYFTTLIEGLDARRFDVHVWYGGGVIDANTQRVAAKVSAFVPTQADALSLAHTIRQAELDVLVYPEIGMDPKHQVLAALRLAPVQCVLYGHPATSGAANIDYFLSGAELEPPQADRHYREKLVRLPGLGTQPSPSPAPGNAEWFTSQTVGAPVLPCLQNLIKLVPAFDHTLARIVTETGARIAFFARSPPLTQRFRARIEAVFARPKLDSSRHLVFLSAQKYPDYLAGIACAPFVLDSPWFSGGGTSLDAFSVGTPVLAWDGTMARARQTSGMLRMMGIEDLIATDEEDYLAKALVLCADASRRADLRERIGVQRSTLFADTAAINAFANFLEQAASAAR